MISVAKTFNLFGSVITAGQAYVYVSTVSLRGGVGASILQTSWMKLETSFYYCFQHHAKNSSL
jgi:hypothetical protein